MTNQVDDADRKYAADLRTKLGVALDSVTKIMTEARERGVEVSFNINAPDKKSPFKLTDFKITKAVEL